MWKGYEILHKKATMPVSLFDILRNQLIIIIPATTYDTTNLKTYYRLQF